MTFTAATITVRQTLELLDGPFLPVAKGVAEDRYALWLGSGISFGRVPGLQTIIGKVIEYLRSHIDPADTACPFRSALDRALNLASPTAPERARFDISVPFSAWPDTDAIVRRLSTNYARFLDTLVDGKDEDFLLWEAADVRSTYANPSLEPDVEHLCVAILILEGVASTVASANWDGLLERALTKLYPSTNVLVVCVKFTDLRTPALRSTLYKFHGCAVKATANEGEYRRFLVARQSQINGWLSLPDNLGVVDALGSLIGSKPTLMMGLSAQDANIQSLFANSEARTAWPWPGDRPSFVFSEDQVGTDQIGLLQNVYRATFNATNRQAIVEGSLLRAYARQLLPAVVLHALTSKVIALIDLLPGLIDPAGRGMLKEGAITLRNAAASGADGLDRLAYVNALINYVSYFLALFRNGTGVGVDAYEPALPVPIQSLAAYPGLNASGFRECSIAIGLLGLGVLKGWWSLALSKTTDIAAGVLTISNGRRTCRVLLTANSHSALTLVRSGHVEDAPDVVVIQAGELASSYARTPRTPPGRTGKAGAQDVSIASIFSAASSIDELAQRFRMQVSM
ncbi:hypothetical protein DSM104443_04048 [Usitatibacter rugosus]|uniref:Uncharacterized protein n=1 Tax=Usitatibacter rugosus TaxID=2732067 RepID=A0A6M4H320_9PROT|nr:SIR2 family protein [Usitatibacter rugosus]QJR12954.1 hypothetical protein DSM104443_04048 [Usitatibacter rugosus]